MAESGDEQAQIIQTFKNFVKASGGGKAMTEDQLKEITDKGVNKMLKACCSDAIAKAGEAQVFTAVNGKAKKMSLDTFLNKFLPDLAATVLHNEMTKKDRTAKKLGIKEEPVVTKLNKIRKDIAAKHDSASAGVAVSGVTQRLTDTSKYTGSHQSRFGSDGKGKGLEGREDRADNSGYVGGYKNEGSYATKK